MTSSVALAPAVSLALSPPTVELITVTATPHYDPCGARQAAPATPRVHRAYARRHIKARLHRAQWTKTPHATVKARPVPAPRKVKFHHPHRPHARLTLIQDTCGLPQGPVGAFDLAYLQSPAAIGAPSFGIDASALDGEVLGLVGSPFDFDFPTTLGAGEGSGGGSGGSSGGGGTGDAAALAPAVAAHPAAAQRAGFSGPTAPPPVTAGPVTAGAAPEPHTWAYLIFGFARVGQWVRRRARTVRLSS
jgi:hypothetical protein